MPKTSQPVYSVKKVKLHLNSDTLAPPELRDSFLIIMMSSFLLSTTTRKPEALFLVHPSFKQGTPFIAILRTSAGVVHRNTLQMPLSRKKSCARCRESKLRCDRSLPSCSRCARKQIKCVYDGRDSERFNPYPERSWDSRVNNDSAPVMYDLPVNELLDTSPLSWNWEMSNSFDVGSSQLASGISDSMVFDAESLFMGGGDKGLTSLLSPETSVRDTPLDNLASQSSQAWSVNDDSESTLIRPTGTQPLERRHILSHCLLSVVVVGQLTSYPKMLIEGDRLPPFIKARCHSDEELAPECYQKRKHLCLPPDLAVCASMVELFYYRREPSTTHVWDLIYGEIRRLRDKVCGLILLFQSSLPPVK